MSLNITPSGERTHISFFGKRNVGKSSLVNAVTGQKLAVVSDTKGTTTDPVYKAMELLPIGPVMIIDTPGYDDVGELGELRVQKTMEVLNKTDIAILVLEVEKEMSRQDAQYIELFQKKNIPYLIVYNKADLLNGERKDRAEQEKEDQTKIWVSAEKKVGINALKEKIAHMTGTQEEKHLVADLVSQGDYVVLVIPIDSSAPKGRLILPQQQMIRDLLEAGAIALCCKDTELSGLIEEYGEKISLVITDSQAFEMVAKTVPENIPLTSFSILMARYKGFLSVAAEGVSVIRQLKDGARILIAEGCTHHRQCEDIGTVKLPKWLTQYTKKELVFETCSGREFPDDLSEYDMVIHCGGCMLNEREILCRMERAVSQNVPFTNYGITIAYLKGILQRSTEIVRDSQGKIL